MPAENKFSSLRLSLADTDLEALERQCLLGTGTYFFYV